MNQSTMDIEQPSSTFFESDVSFQSDVIERLNRIENMVTTFASQSDLIQELIRKDLRNNYNNTNNDQKQWNDQRPMSFLMTTVKKQDDDDMPISIRISGRTYDIRDRIKQYGAVWKGEFKAWEVDYTDDTYKAIMMFLQSLTNDIREESTVV